MDQVKYNLTWHEHTNHVKEMLQLLVVILEPSVSGIAQSFDRAHQRATLLFDGVPSSARQELARPPPTGARVDCRKLTLRVFCKVQVHLFIQTMISTDQPCAASGHVSVDAATPAFSRMWRHTPSLGLAEIAARRAAVLAVLALLVLPLIPSLALPSPASPWPAFFSERCLCCPRACRASSWALALPPEVLAPLALLSQLPPPIAHR